jgi:hypothetical protein
MLALFYCSLKLISIRRCFRVLQNNIKANTNTYKTTRDNRDKDNSIYKDVITGGSWRRLIAMHISSSTLVVKRSNRKDVLFPSTSCRLRQYSIQQEGV